MAELQEPKPGEKRVWMSCRATKGCEGNYAVIVFQKDLNQIQPGGGFDPKGNVVRYRCLTCGKSFHITR